MWEYGVESKIRLALISLNGSSDNMAYPKPNFLCLNAVLHFVLILQIKCAIHWYFVLTPWLFYTVMLILHFEPFSKISKWIEGFEKEGLQLTRSHAISDLYVCSIAWSYWFWIMSRKLYQLLVIVVAVLEIALQILPHSHLLWVIFAPIMNKPQLLLADHF